MRTIVPYCTCDAVRGEGDEGVRTIVPYLQCSARLAAAVLEMAVLETALVADCLASGTRHAPTFGQCLVCTTLLSR